MPAVAGGGGGGGGGGGQLGNQMHRRAAADVNKTPSAGQWPPTDLEIWQICQICLLFHVQFENNVGQGKNLLARTYKACKVNGVVLKVRQENKASF